MERKDSYSLDVAVDKRFKISFCKVNQTLRVCVMLCHVMSCHVMCHVYPYHKGKPFFLKQYLAVLHRLDCSGATIAHSNLKLLTQVIFLVSASQVAGIAGMCHHSQPIF